MVVKFLQKGDQVAMNATRTIFSDVTSRHWALGYVNLASSLTVGGGSSSSGSSDGGGDSAPAAALISGVGNGRFDPDAKISLAQAATILIRVLGYQTQQVGAVWPESYLNLAASIGLVALLYQAGVDELLAKLLVDLGLAIASYQVQMRWVFRVDQAEKGAVAEEAERL